MRIGLMRGERVSAGLKKLDLVIVAARYERDDSRLAQVRGYERRGPIWTDLRVYNRQELVQRLRAGERVAAGRCRTLPGDFEVITHLRLADEGDTETLITEGALGGQDRLPVPRF